MNRITLSLLACLLATPTIAGAQVCAKVKIEIVQELTLERQAFDAHMKISNGLKLLSVKDFEVEVVFQDAVGAPVVATSDPDDETASFFITLDALENIDAVDGTGVIAPETTADIHWLIIPAAGAAGPDPAGTLYFVGANVGYTIGDEKHEVSVIPDSIYVRPMPQLFLDYFLPEDVHADNPYTDATEPPEPFTLGVRVANQGLGPANALKIESSQPKIVENEQGLLVAFEIIGSEVNGQAATHSLLVDFGTIKPDKAGVARWFMTTTLQGKFTEFSATFSHSDALGGQLTSLLEEVKTHVLLRDVLVVLPGRDSVRDFLAQDPTLIKVYESDLVDSEVFDASSASSLSQPNGATLIIDAPATAGFSFIRLANPLASQQDLLSVLRSDGTTINLHNAWQSRVWKKAAQKHDHFINVFDVNNTGGWDYTLAFGEASGGNQAPVFGPLVTLKHKAGQALVYPVTATDPEGSAVVLSAGVLPAGATFADLGGGSGVINWTPTEAQTGTYVLDLAATDGAAVTKAAATLIVVSANAENSAPTSASAQLAAVAGSPSPPVTPVVVDPDEGDAHVFVIVGQATFGVASVVGGQLVYTANAGIKVKADSFTFKATDLFGESVVGTAQVTISGICPGDPDDDGDNDGICGGDDNCPALSNPDQLDADEDGVGDECDGCPELADADQADGDQDGVGDACDVCPATADPDQEDTETWTAEQVLNGGFEDVLGAEWSVTQSAGLLANREESPDATGDWLFVMTAPAGADGQATLSQGLDLTDVDSVTVALAAEQAGDVTFEVSADGLVLFSCAGDCTSNAALVVDTSAVDGAVELSFTLLVTGVFAADRSVTIDAISAMRAMVGDGVGDVCDVCPAAPDPDQLDTDDDTVGDVCDACPLDADNDVDGDAVCGEVDLCPAVSDPDQLDADQDGAGDACDACPNDPDKVLLGICGCAVADVDTDQDGVVDCEDVCPADAGNDADEDGVCASDGDCDDGDGDNFPGNPEVCDGQDNNCDGGDDFGGAAGSEACITDEGACVAEGAHAPICQDSQTTLVCTAGQLIATSCGVDSCTDSGGADGGGSCAATDHACVAGQCTLTETSGADTCGGEVSAPTLLWYACQGGSACVATLRQEADACAVDAGGCAATDWSCTGGVMAKADSAGNNSCAELELTSWSCDEAGKACQSTLVTCGDNNGCTDDLCDAVAGCVETPNTAPCDDGSACTSEDVCAGGSCSGVLVDCDDQDVCTDDGCDPATGCTASLNTAPCDDTDACTLEDTCAQGSCAGSPVVCDDANPCTADACEAGQCAFVPDDAATVSCYGGAAETEGVGACKAGVQTCVSGVAQACEGAVLPAVELCANALDDDCDGQTDEPQCAAEDLQLDLAEVDFALKTGSAGFLVGLPVSLGGGAATVGLTAVHSKGAGVGGTVTASTGPLKADASYAAKKLPGASVSLIVRQPHRWADDRQVVGVVTVRDALGQSQIAPTTVTLRLEYAGQPDVLAACITNANGICDAVATLPLAWFGSTDGVATATAELGAEVTPAQAITLHATPELAAEVDPGVTLVLPMGPRHAGTSFDVPVIATSGKWPIEAFDVSVSFDPSVLGVGKIALHPAYDGATNVTGSLIKLVGVKQAVATSPIQIATITFSVLPSAVAEASGALGGTIVDFLTVQNAPLVASGAALGGSGAVVVANNPVRGITAVSDRAHLFDTGELSTDPNVATVTVRAVRAFAPDLDVTSEASCTAAPDCVVSPASAELGALLVGVSYSGVQTTAPFSVWKPTLPVEVTLGDAQLSPIDGWLDADCLAPIFQSSRVTAQTTFSNGPDEITVQVPVEFEATDVEIANVVAGRVVGVTAGSTDLVAKGPNGIVGTTPVSVGGAAVLVTGLDVVVATGMSALPIGAAVDGSAYGERPVTASVHQVLDAEGATGHVLTWARLSDGTRASVSPADGLALVANEPDALAVQTEPPGVTALKTADGALVGATLTVCDQTVATGAGVVSITLPEPSGALLALSEPRIAVDPTDPAAVIGVPTSADVTVTLEYENGTSADFTLDERTVYDAQSGDPSDLFALVVEETGVTVVATGKGVGTAALNVSFEHTDVTASISVVVVEHAGFVLDAHPWPTYPGSAAVSKTTLKQLEGTGAYQQAVLELRCVLSDGFEIDVSAHPAVGYVAAGTALAVVATHRISPVEPGSATISASLAGATSAPLPILVTSAPVTIVGLTTSFPSTFTGIADVKQTQLQVSASFDDGTQLADATAVPGLLTYESSDPDKASIDADGLVTLHANHHQLATLTATSLLEAASSLTACNLLPALGDIDLGQTMGVPHPDVAPGELFTMPVVVNTGAQALGSIDVTITYDPAVIAALAGQAGADWPGGQLEVTLNDPPGTIHIVGAASPGTQAKGAALHVVDLTFQGKKDDTTITPVNGTITKLLENTTEQAAIGEPLAPGETRPIVAGAGLLDPDCADGSDPWDHVGNANGDCEFSVGDVSFTLFYLAGLVDPAALAPFQLEEMDADFDGSVDVADAVYLLRVVAGKFRFVDVAITPPAGLNGTLSMQVTLTDQYGDPVSAQSTVWFEVATQANTEMMLTVGSLEESTANGVLLLAEPQGDGVFTVEATDFATSEADIGVVAIVQTSDALGQTSTDRIVALHGTPWLNELLPFTPVDAFSITALPGDCKTDVDCNDENACTQGDACVSGTCVLGEPADCDDANACTDDSCDATTGCVSTPNSAPCDDGDACTGADTCGLGLCVGGVALACDDANACTDDSCDATTGCVYADNTADCDDGNACTEGDVCAAGDCASGAALACEDANPCTDDGCDAATGCVSTPNSAPCDDGDACTEGDVCAGGDCTSGAALACDDANPCSTDSCDSTEGCQHVLLDECCETDAHCDDSNACTTDTCDVATGGCSSSAAMDCDDADACTEDSCNTDTGECEHTAITDTPECKGDCLPQLADTMCQGGNLLWIDACGEPGPVAIDCNDGDPCTLDTCDAAAKACVHDPTGATACAGDPCEGDAVLVCQNGHVMKTDACGVAVSVAQSCDDADECTQDVCDATGPTCAHTATPECHATCDQAITLACQQGDLMWLDACQTAFALAERCDDEDDTTDDACDPTLTACTHEPIATETEPGSEAEPNAAEPNAAEPETSPDTGSITAPDAGTTTFHVEPKDSGCQTGTPTPLRWWLVFGLLALLIGVRRRGRTPEY